MNTKKFILAAFFAVTIVGQVQANLCTKISTCVRNAATRVVNSRVGNFTKAQASRVSHFLVPRYTRVHKTMDLWKSYHPSQEVLKLRYKTGYIPLKWGEGEEIRPSGDVEVDISERYDTRTVYNWRRLIALGGLTTLYVTYKLGERAGKKQQATQSITPPTASK